MKNLSFAVRVLALALGVLVTQSCEEADTPHGHYHGDRYDDHPRYAPDHEYSEGRYRPPDHEYSEGRYGPPDADRRRGGYDEEDEDRQPSIVIPVPAY
ncbi:MAG TPA: hypothetical protein VGD78_18785 [Chthoniobacterales bacterium]